MPLSCSCDFDHDFEPGQWLYIVRIGEKLDFQPFPGPRRKRCCSCNTLIDLGSPCLIHMRERYPYDDIEAQIKTGLYIEDALAQEPTIQLSDHYHCEICGEIWLNLTAIGYECLFPAENMQSALKEYHEITGFLTKKGGENERRSQDARIKIS